jgi:hypothetical protein
MASFTFNAAEVEPSAPAGVIPAGTYLAQVTESDLKMLKSGNGDGLSLTFSILDGEFKNRKVWTNLNVRHTNPEAQRIGQQQLSTLCHALGVLNMTDTAQLHNRPVKIRVKIRKDEQYGDKNEVAGYEPASGNGIANAPTAPRFNPAAPAPQAAPATGAPSKAPWM